MVVLPYDLEIKHVFPENIQVITEFSKRTGDYQSLSATDIKVMALTYQLEKENVGLDHLKNEPVMPCTVTVETHRSTTMLDADVTGFYVPGHKGKSKEESILSNESEKEETNIKSQVKDVENGKQQSNDLQKQLLNKFETLQCSDEHYDNEKDLDNILQPITESVVEENLSNSDEDEDCAGSNSEAEGDDDVGWITPSNIQKAKKQINSKIMEEKSVKVACVTTDFAMQNVLKQINLNVSALDGRIIKQLRTFILRCYSCFGTTSIMTKLFCPKCGNKTLKRVAVSLDEDGKQQIHINGKHPLTARGKKFSLPRIKGGKHSNNPRLVEDQPMPDQRPTRLARTKTDPLDDDYIAGLYNTNSDIIKLLTFLF